MELEYIKLNENIIECKNSVNYIVAENDSGKSSLVYLIKFILGGKESLFSEDNFFKDYRQYKKKNKKVYLEWKYNNLIYKFDLFEEVLYENEQEISSKEYYEKYRKCVNIFGKNVNINNQIYLTDINVLIKKPTQLFFPSSSRSYNAYLMLNLLNEISESTDDMYVHFSEVAQIKKITNSASNVKKQFTEELSELDIKNYSEIHELYMEFNKLKEIKKETLDLEIVNELKELLIDNTRIDEAIKYHKALINDYNSLIKLEKQKIKEKIKQSEKNTVSNDVAKIYSEFITHSETLSQQKKAEIKNRTTLMVETDIYLNFEKKIDSINARITNFVSPKYKQLFDKEYLYKNNFNITADIENLEFSFAASDSPGLGSRQINYVLVMLYALKQSQIMDYFVMDTIVSNEIDEKITGLDEIVRTEIKDTQKKIFWFVHPSNKLATKHDNKCIYTQKNPIFIPLKK